MTTPHCQPFLTGLTLHPSDCSDLSCTNPPAPACCLFSFPNPPSPNSHNSLKHSFPKPQHLAAALLLSLPKNEVAHLNSRHIFGVPGGVTLPLLVCWKQPQPLQPWGWWGTHGCLLCLGFLWKWTQSHGELIPEPNPMENWWAGVREQARLLFVYTKQHQIHT